MNRGPRLSARAFGPATAGVLLLLWAMVIGTVWRRGFHLPSLQLEAFGREHLHFTLGGYARILALMTGVEVFANLVAAYEGTPKEKSRKAFGSLLIIMGTTSITMLVVGPAILALSDPANHEVSVFTQTMDRLLPGPLAYLGTLIGAAVLLSASAASAQGLQNLALGLRYRHYVPAFVGRRNTYGVADAPVWIEVGLVVLCFVAFGTREETYLAIYAAGVFVLLSLTGWAVVKRLLRTLKSGATLSGAAALAGTATAAVLTTGATLIIFEERLGRLIAETRYVKALQDQPLFDERVFKNILVPLDQSRFAEQALPLAQSFGRACDARLTLLSVVPPRKGAALSVAEGDAPQDEPEDRRRRYLDDLSLELNEAGLGTESLIRHGDPSEEIFAAALERHADLIVMCTHGRSLTSRWLTGSVTTRMVHYVAPPLLVLRPTDDWKSTRSRFKRLLVPLDGSESAEQVLPYVRALAGRFGSEILLLSVPEGSESEAYGTTIQRYLEGIAGELKGKGLKARWMATGSGPARTIVSVSDSESIDLIMMVTHGRGGLDRMDRVKVGSVTDGVIQATVCPVFVVSARRGPLAAV